MRQQYLRRGRILLLTLIILSTVLGACAAPLTPAADTSVEPVALDGYAKPELLVDSAWILEHADDPNVRLIDVSGNADTYAAGHIPGAVYVSVGEQMTNPEDSTRGQIMTQDALSELLSSLGVTHDTTIVLYDGNNNLQAARAYWVLKYYQHEDVRIFDGGTKTWQADGHELVTDEVAVTPSEYVAKDPDLAIRTTTEYVLERLDDENVIMCDTRNAEEFAGTDVRSARGGHVPGAINIDWVYNVDDDGTFKSAQELYDLYTKAGFSPDKEIITYCQTGVRGAHTWFVLRELLGFPNVRNYDGSWEEYGNLTDTPIES
jgi:thiosulfate/3-mercaptopyruvate sulfurtransferase